jgi:hypothetical protein
MAGLGELQGGRRSVTAERQIVVLPPASVPLYCPRCGKRHVDSGARATLQHFTHVCEDDVAGTGCGAAFALCDAKDGLPLYYFGSADGVGS